MNRIAGLSAACVLCYLVVLFGSLTMSGQSGHENQTVAHPENIPPTTSCEGSNNLDATAECQKRETARLFIILGKPEAALRVLCYTKQARDAFAAAKLDCVKETTTKEK